MDKLEVFKTLDTFIPDGQLIEIRAISSVKKGDIWSGYFKDKNILWNAIQRFDQNYNIYFVLNVINDVCYSTLQHETMVWGADTTKDKDIVARNWVLIDLDTERGGKKVSSTDEEWQKARMKAHEVRNFLRDQGFSYPVVCHSGNGIHLDYRIDSWANTDENEKIIERFLKALSALFSDDDVKVDVVVKNAARVDKLYGTYARKGANTRERPHRLSRILLLPDEVKYTDKEYFVKVGNILPEDNPVHDYREMRTYDKFDIDEFIKKHNIEVAKDTTNAGIRKIVLKECPFDSSHKAPDSALFVMPNGAIGFMCFHQSCSQYTFKDFRMKFEPDAYDHKDYAEFQHKQKYYGYHPVPFVPIKETEGKGKKWLTSKDIKRKRERDLIAIPTGFYLLDKVIRGLLLGEVTIMSGINGSGKSSWLNTLILNVIHRGYKVATFSGELTDFNMMKWLAQSAAGKNYLDKIEGSDYAYDVQDAAYDKIMDWLYEKFYLFNNNYGNQFEQILSDVNEVIEKGVNLIILDNLMALSIDGKGGDKNDKQKAFILDLVTLAKTKNVHIIVVAHPRKESGLTLLRKESISGSGDLTNAVQNVFIIHRVGEDFQKRASEFFGKEKTERYMEYDNIIEVCKNRSYGVNDLLVGMYYEVESKRFKNNKSEHVVYGWQDQTNQTQIPFASSPNEPTNNIGVSEMQSVYDNIGTDGDFFVSSDECPF